MKNKLTFTWNSNTLEATRDEIGSFVNEIIWYGEENNFDSLGKFTTDYPNLAKFIKDFVENKFSNIEYKNPQKDLTNLKMEKMWKSISKEKIHSIHTKLKNY